MCVRRRALHRDARFALGFRGISLLQQDGGKVQPSRHQVRLEPKGGLEMGYCRGKFALLPQDPAQGGLRLSTTVQAANRLRENRTTASKVASLEAPLSSLY